MSTERAAAAERGPVRTRALEQRGWVVALRTLLAFLVVPNVLFLFAGHLTYLARPLINLDYLMVGLVLGSLPTGALVGVVALTLVIDTFVTLAPAFHIALDVALSSLVSLRTASALPIAAVVLLVIAGAAVGASSMVWLAPRQRSGVVSRASLLVAAVIVAALDILGGTSRFSRGATFAPGVNLATSGILVMFDALRSAPRDAGTTAAPGVAPLPSGASANLLQVLRVSSGADSIGAQNLVLIIVESLGLPVDAVDRGRLLEPFSRDGLLRRYRVRSGTILSHGATTDGEIRELCGVAANHLQLERVPKAACLPSLLSRRGFRTMAFHGFTGNLFGRNRWWPQLGFNQVLFAEDLASTQGTHRCGSMFRGICDHDIAEIIHKRLVELSGERLFIYWVTLNTHFPYDVPRTADSGALCGGLPTLAAHVEACRLARGLGSLFNDIVFVASDSALRPTRFLVVGDHSPPFLSGRERSLFAQDSVPFVDLIPLGSKAR